MGVGDDRFFTPLRYVQNDMWVAALRSGWHRGMGKRDGSPHARGQREGESGGGRFPNRPYEGLVAQHLTGDHKEPVS